MYGDEEHPGLLSELSKRAGVLKICNDGNKVAIGKQDTKRLQVLQNKMLRLLSRAYQSTPTSTLTSLARSLSVR